MSELEYVDPQQELVVRINRIPDSQYSKQARNSLTIRPDYLFWLRFSRKFFDETAAQTSMARFYATFSHAYGASGQQYDDWKGAFSFCFDVRVSKGATVFPYVLKVIHLRSSVEFVYGKVKGQAEAHLDRDILYKPFEEFSREQMNAVSAFLCSYAASFWQSTQHLGGQPEFVKWVDSNLILFGYQAGEFFETHYNDPETFEADKARLSGLLDTLPPITRE